MRETNLDLFDPRTGMDYSPNGDFGFAFNDSNFSDRVLRIEIVADPPESCSDGDTCLSLANWDRHRKRRREDVKKDNGYCLSCVLIKYIGTSAAKLMVVANFLIHKQI